MKLKAKLMRWFALLLHDLVAHPLIGLSGGAKWAWRLHDSVGEVATVGAAGTVLRLDGPGPLFRQAQQHLLEAGWIERGQHLHEDGRGCGSYEYPQAPYTAQALEFWAELPHTLPADVSIRPSYTHQAFKTVVLSKLYKMKSGNVRYEHAPADGRNRFIDPVDIDISSLPDTEEWNKVKDLLRKHGAT